ncbi:enoyl-CoA hydratase [Bdellovibrio sp. qaytius]|nr:enoyl-CoA hydratase [Bdellovibrio sp. qaytius]
MNISISSDLNDNTIKIVELNKPELKNAFNPEMISEITEIFQKLSKDKTVRAVVLKGAGTAFCAGADLNWMKSMVDFSFEQNIKDSEKLWDMFEAIALCEAPVIGLVHGAAFGGALGLIAACDYVIADEATKYCFSEVKLGLSPAVISSFILRKCADSQVRPYMLNAEIFDSHTAQRLGLVHVIKNIEDGLTEARKFSNLGLEAIRETKKLLNNIEISKYGSSWATQKKLTTTVISERRMSKEGQERLKGFLNKSK